MIDNSRRKLTTLRSAINHVDCLVSVSHWLAGLQTSSFPAIISWRWHLFTFSTALGVFDVSVYTFMHVYVYLSEDYQAALALCVEQARFQYFTKWCPVFVMIFVITHSHVKQFCGTVSTHVIVLTLSHSYHGTSVTADVCRCANRCIFRFCLKVASDWIGL